MFSFFNSKKRVFNNQLKNAAKAVLILSKNPFMTSLSQQENARTHLKEIKAWWESNVDIFKNELSIDESDFELMRKCLQLPDIAKYRNTNGKKIIKYPNGQIEYEWNYSNGGKHGIQKGWHENGRVSFEQNYLNDHMDGLQRSWYENGNIQSEYNYRFTNENTNGLSQNVGWQREYYENGVLKEEEFYNEITYKREKLIRYREDASIKELRVFNDNEIICKEYDEIGGVINEWEKTK
jgi:antitoxin component YwqK of YwqJK toxin-antitoxin module